MARLYSTHIGHNAMCVKRGTFATLVVLVAIQCTRTLAVFDEIFAAKAHEQVQMHDSDNNTDASVMAAFGRTTIPQHFWQM